MIDLDNLKAGDVVIATCTGGLTTTDGEHIRDARGDKSVVDSISDDRKIAS